MTASARPARRADLDLLRVFAVFLLFPFHAAKVYDPEPWYHVWSPDLVPGLQYFTGFVHLWHMPLLFFLAGWSAVVSLRGRGLGRFVWERMRRLALPLLFGTVFLCPILKYVELRSGVSIGTEGLGATAALQEAHGALQARPLPVVPEYEGSFLEFLPTFYSPERITWSHLWFVAYLLVFSLVYAPLLARLARAHNALPRPTLALWAPAVALVAGEILLRPHFPGIQTLVGDWANVVKYSIYLLAGALFAAQPAVEDRARAQWGGALGAGLGLSLGLLLVDAMPLPAPLARALGDGLSALAGWCLVVASLGIAARVARPGPRLAWLAAAGMPIYVLHQLGVVLAAWWIDPIPVPATVRLGLVLVASVAGVLLVYALVVQRVGWLSAALGSKALRPGPAERGEPERGETDPSEGGPGSRPGPLSERWRARRPRRSRS